MMATKNSTFVTPIVSILDKLGIDRTDWLGENYLSDSPMTELKTL